MSEAPTIRNIARRAQVSPCTVSQVLNNKGSFKETTRKKVLDAAHQLGYKQSAKNSQGNELKRLAIVFPPELRSGISENHLFMEFYEAMVQHLSEDVSTLVVQNDAELFPLASAIARGELSALIAFAAGKDHPTFKRLQDHGIPALAIMRQFDGSAGISWVSIDHRQAAYDATRHLIGLGHKRITFVIPHEETGYMEQRLSGFHAACADAGLPADMCRTIHQYVDNDIIMDELFAQKPMPTAVFVSPDSLAAKVIARAKAQGLRVPADLAVVGFDDLPVAQECSPKITTIGYSRQLLGETIVAALQTVLAKGLVSVGITIPHQLIIRESCGYAAQGGRKREKPSPASP